MSDLVYEPVQEPPDVANVGPPTSIEGVTDTVDSCFDSAKSNAADLRLPSSTKSPDSECVKSEEHALEKQEGGATVDCCVSQGVI